MKGTFVASQPRRKLLARSCVYSFAKESPLAAMSLLELESQRRLRLQQPLQYLMTVAGKAESSSRKGGCRPLSWPSNADNFDKLEPAAHASEVRRQEKDDQQKRGAKEVR